MANDKQLHPELINNVAQLENVAPGAFCFFGSTYKSLSLFPPDDSEINIPKADEIVEQIPRILETYPPAACLYIFEEVYRRHNLDLQEEQNSALRTAYLNILQGYSSKPHVRELADVSKLMRVDDKNFIPEFKTDLALNLKLGFKRENTVTLQDILADLAAHPKNADFYFNAESFFRGHFVNNPQIIEQLIQLNKPEVYRAIRKQGLIDTIPYRWWKRNELYAALEEAEKLAPAEFVLHRYFDAPQAGYYARKRLAKYKAEVEQLPVEFKVEYILKNPERAEYFFADTQFMDELKNRRPDLLFKLLNLKEKLLRPDDLRFKLFNDSLLGAALKVGEYKEIQQLQGLLDEMGWTKTGHPLLRLKVDAAANTAAKKIKEAEKGKQEAGQVVASVTTAKVELSDITQLDQVLNENQHCKKLEVYTPSAIVVVDFSQQQKKLLKKHSISIYRTDLNTSLYLPEEYSIGTCSVSTSFVSSNEFQQSYRAKVSPAEMNFQPIHLGFFARVGQWLSRVFTRNIVTNPVKKATIQIASGTQSSSAAKMTRVLSGSESLIEDTDTQGDSRDDEEYQDVAAPEKLYLSARRAFINGNYKEAMQKICECAHSILKHQKSTGAKSEDERTFVVNRLIEILQKTKADLFDYLMVDELMQQEMPDIGPVVSLRTAVIKLFGEFTLNESNFSGIPEQWRGPFQLFILEREFLHLKNPNTIDYKREVGRLQEQYMAVLKEHSEMPLARAMAAKSRLVSYQASTEIAKSRVTVMNMFARDPKGLIAQMFDTLASNNVANPAKFISGVMTKVGFSQLIDYVRDIHPKGFEILLDKSPDFRRLLFTDQLKLKAIIRKAAQFRQALRKHVTDELPKVQQEIQQAFELDVQNVLDGDLSAEEKFSDPFFIDEIEADPQQRDRIFERDDLYLVYGKYGQKYADVALLFERYARNENPPEDSLSKVIAKAGMRQVLNCILGNCPNGLRILLEKYPEAREILRSKESYLRALAGSDFPEVRHTLRQCGFELSDDVQKILARKMRKNVEAITDHEKAVAKLSDKFFVAELFLPENGEELKKFEATFPGLLHKVIAGQMYSLAEYQGQFNSPPVLAPPGL